MIQRFKRFLKHIDQKGQILLNGMLQNIQIDIEIGMNQSVAHSNNIFPGYFRQFIASLIGYLIGRFANDFNTLHQRKGQFAVCIQFTSATLASKLHALLSGIQHMLQANPVILAHIEPLLPAALPL